MKTIVLCIIILLMSNCMGQRNAPDSQKEASSTGNTKDLFIDATATNILYIGVDNPISINNAGDTNHEIQLSANDPNVIIKRLGKGKFAVQPIKMVHQLELTVKSGGNSRTQKFLVQNIPRPIAKLGGKSYGEMGTGEFRAQAGLYITLDQFTIEAKCEVYSFELTRISEGEKHELILNEGARYSGATRALVKKAVSGDIYLYENIKSQCPGYPSPRTLIGITIRIK